MNHDPDKSILLQLRNAAKVEVDELKRFKMRDAADKIQAATNIFKDAPCSNHLRDLVGAWTSGVRALGLATPVNGPTPPRSDAARERKVA
jgi:hypothetical protein